MTTFLEETNKELNSLLWKMTEPTKEGAVPMSPKTMEVLQDFVASCLTLQRKEMREMVEGMKMARDRVYFLPFEDGYNKALSDVLNALGE